MDLPQTRPLCLKAIGLAGLLLLPRVGAAADYPQGTYELTPQIDLELRAVPVSVPPRFDRFAGMTLALPAGFSAGIFAADGLRNPRFMAFSPDGVLHLANMGAGQIVALPDGDDDGVADEVVVVARGFAEANSMAFYKGDLYVADTHQILRLHDDDGDGIYAEREKHVLVDLPSPGPCCENGWHTTRTLVFDELHDKLYVGIGMPCDLCRSEQPYNADSLEPLPPNPEWGTILQFNADGTGRRIFATGIRNVVGMTLHPVTGELWGDHNGYDIGGPHIPPEWIDIIRDGDFMGYPFAYGYQAIVDSTSSAAYDAEDWHVAAIRSQRLDKVPGLYRKVGVFPLTRQDSLLVQRQKRPVALVDGHLAPLGIHFYTHDLFPSRYLNAAFVALHNGRNEGSLAAAPGFKVVAIFSHPDGSDARMADFIGGFGPSPEDPDRRGAPVGIVSDSRGRLYVSDNYRRLIFRISHTFIDASWEHALPDTVVIGSTLEVDIAVRPLRTDPQRPLEVIADLAAFGGPASSPLPAVADSLYRLRDSLPVAGAPGVRAVTVVVRQDPRLDGYQMRLTKMITVLPQADFVVLDEGIDPAWQVSTRAGAEALVADGVGPAYRGSLASPYRVEPERSVVPWEVELRPPVPVEVFGYGLLRFAIRPDGVRTGSFTVFNFTMLGPTSVATDLARGPAQVRVNLDQDRWQVVEIPLAGFAGPLQGLRLVGNFSGTFRLDDLRLVTAARVPPTTAVVGSQAAVPGDFALAQSYPNPFNSATVIPFVLGHRAQIRLAVYDLAGQEVVILAAAQFPAGSHIVPWDGRDGRGRQLASGVYVCRMFAAGRAYSRKLVLLR